MLFAIQILSSAINHKKTLSIELVEILEHISLWGKYENLESSKYMKLTLVTLVTAKMLISDSKPLVITQTRCDYMLNDALQFKYFIFFDFEKSSPYHL